MNQKKIRVGILFGGKSAEHEVSLQSAKNVADAIDTEKYEVILIGIDKTGKWLLPNQSNFLLNEDNPELVRLNVENKIDTALIPQSGGELLNVGTTDVASFVDVVFPILHGPFGEDGTVQGLLKLAGIPFVGAGVLGSAVGMDKDVMKRLLRDAGIPISKFLVFERGEEVDFDTVTSELGLPIFVKPANMGSSVGVGKVHTQEEFTACIEEAYLYDTKIIVEEFIDGRELECGVLGNQNPQASIVGEVTPNQDFYSYDAKYVDENGAELNIPANIDAGTMKRVQELAIKTFKTLSCEGLGRVDCFLTNEGRLVMNEINTIPGFTKVSMYPQLWKASGVSYSELIDKLIILAIDRFEREKNLKTSH